MEFSVEQRSKGLVVRRYTYQVRVTSKRWLEEPSVAGIQKWR